MKEYSVKEERESGREESDRFERDVVCERMVRRKKNSEK